MPLNLPWVCNVILVGELARAQIAHQLKKEYSQDEELDWGCLIDKKTDNMLKSKELGPTFKKRK